MSEQGDPLGIVQETEIWPYDQIVYAQTRIRLGEWDARIIWHSERNRSPNPGQW